MSNKGRTFTSDDAPRTLRERSPEKARRWAEEQTARNAIVAYDDKRPVIAEELEARALVRLSAKARRAAGMLLRCTPDVRREVLAAFASDGSLKLPFEFVPATGEEN